MTEPAQPRRYPIPDNAQHDMIRVMTDAEGQPVVMFSPEVCEGPDEWGLLLGLVVQNLVHAHKMVGAAILDKGEMRPMTEGEILEVIVGSMREYLETPGETEFKVEKIGTPES